VFCQPYTRVGHVPWLLAHLQPQSTITIVRTLFFTRRSCLAIFSIPSLN
jgi:hypothetical protein